MVVAVGLGYSPETKDWTERVEYVARDRMEAIRWMSFNKNWMKGLHIEEGKRDGSV